MNGAGETERNGAGETARHGAGETYNKVCGPVILDLVVGRHGRGVVGQLRDGHGLPLSEGNDGQAAYSTPHCPPP